MRNSNYPHDVRTSLGLSLSDFAELITCSKSQLAMIESGKRFLSLNSITWLRVVNNATEIAEKTDENSFLNTEALEKQKDAQLKKLKNKRDNLEFKLPALEEAANKNLFLLKTALAWQSLPKPDENEFPGLQMVLISRDAKQKYNEQVLLLQQLKIELAGVLAQISAIENM